MASPLTPLSQPAPLRAPDSPAPPLHHPTPDLQSLQGAYIGNIERLEDHAERISEHGSDIGEEIRKLQLEQKITEGSHYSFRSAAPSDDAARKPFDTRSRGASTSSYANSIVDTNTAARWGGYSPAGYVTSPVGSLRSGSFSPQSAPIPLQRQRSGSRASRLGQVLHAEEDEEEPGSPQSHKSGPARPRSVSSFTRQFDEITQEIQEGLGSGLGYMDTKPHNEVDNDRPQAHADRPDRPPTAASTDTRQAETDWRDFDGVHCPDTVPEEDPAALSPESSRNSSLIKAPPPMPQGAPPPDDGMVFYPAPVPQMLNLPKRLSKIPAGNVQARRRTQLLESMQAENRKSAPWMTEQDALQQKRKTRQSMANLPPQLRASAYFDQPAPAQEFEVKGESAEETLESILEASAFAPVSAFTDHPFAGHVGNEVYGAHNRSGSKATVLDASDARKSRSTLNLLFDMADARKSRSSLNLLDTRRNSSGDRLNKLQKRNNSADLGVLTVRATESRMSLGDELDEPDHDARGPQVGGDMSPSKRSIDGRSDVPLDEDVGEDERVDEEEEEEQYFGPPTTLLAELQMRKQQQKSRNLTAATAYPDGMHATLLELDAVAEIEKRKRIRQKVNLAWEAEQKGPEDEESDDDVPIGVLYPGTDGLIKKIGGTRQQTSGQQPSDWDRPLGLIERRQLEENEPLSRRRTRLLGVDPNKRRTQLPFNHSQQHLAVPGQTPQPESDDEREGETLAERLRRIKEGKSLDAALGDDIRKSTFSGDFASEMMSQFGVPEEEKPKPTPSPSNDEEETLGQRRARLQAEALARGDADSRPPLRGSMSLANILTAHPIDMTNSSRKVSDEQLLSHLPQGSLLHQSAVEKARRDADKAHHMQRISSYGGHQQPHVGGTKKAAPNQFTPPTARVPSMMFNPMGNMSPAMSNMNLPASRDSYFPQGNMGMAPPFGMSGMAMTPGGPVTPQQMMAMNMSMMNLQNGMQMANPYQQMGRQPSMPNMPMNMNHMTMQMQQQAMMMEPPMDPKQRNMIDQWRNGVV